jgi:hypothetical protein
MSFTGPVIQPGGPACRKAGGVMGSIVPPTPEGGGGFYGRPATDTAGPSLWGNNATVTELGEKASQVYQAAGHPAFGRVSGGYRR